MKPEVGKIIQNNSINSRKNKQKNLKIQSNFWIDFRIFRVFCNIQSKLYLQLEHLLQKIMLLLYTVMSWKFIILSSLKNSIVFYMIFLENGKTCLFNINVFPLR